MNKLWFIRAYAAIILLVVLSGFFEGAANTLVIALAATLIIVWTFLRP